MAQPLKASLTTKNISKVTLFPMAPESRRLNAIVSVKTNGEEFSGSKLVRATVFHDAKADWDAAVHRRRPACQQKLSVEKHAFP